MDLWIFSWPLSFVMQALYFIIKNFGVNIILFTVFTKVILFPLAIKQQKSMAKNFRFKPKIDEINKKYANNKVKQQEELQKLYTAEGYNPLSGCLPMLIQFPILFGIWGVISKPLTYVLRLSGDQIATAVKSLGDAGKSYGEIAIINDVHAGKMTEFFNAETISKIKEFDLSFLGLRLGDIPGYRWSWLLIIPILSGITALASSLLSMHYNKNMSQQQQQAAGMSKGLMIIMPLFSAFIAFSVPVGVAIYWIASNLVMLIQTVIVYTFWNPAVLAKAEEDKIAAEKQAAKEARKKAKQEALERGEEYVDEEEEAEKEKQKMIERAKLSEKERKEFDKKTSNEQKDINRRRLAEARRLDAEKYGEEYEEGDE